MDHLERQFQQQMAELADQYQAGLARFRALDNMVRDPSAQDDVIPLVEVLQRRDNEFETCVWYGDQMWDLANSLKDMGIEPRLTPPDCDHADFEPYISERGGHFPEGDDEEEDDESDSEEEDEGIEVEIQIH